MISDMGFDRQAAPVVVIGDWSFTRTRFSEMTLSSYIACLNNTWQKVEPMAGVGTHKVFEDGRVIVWHLDLQPGAEAERHTHRLDYAVRVVSGSTLEVFGPSGESLDTIELEVGAAVCFRIDGDQIVSDRPGYPAVPTTHSVRNVGTDTFREVLIEFKNP